MKRIMDCLSISDEILKKKNPEHEVLVNTKVITLVSFFHWRLQDFSISN